MLILSGCSLVIFDTGIRGRRFPEIGDSGIARLRLNIVRSMLSSKCPSVFFCFFRVLCVVVDLLRLSGCQMMILLGIVTVVVIVLIVGELFLSLSVI